MGRCEADGTQTTYSNDPVGRLAARNCAPVPGGDYTKLYAY